MVVPGGFEPPLRASKAPVLPLHKRTKWHGVNDLNIQHMVLETMVLPIELTPY